MARYIVTVWETRAYIVPVEAADADEAKEIALEDYTEDSTLDEFVSVEFRELEELEKS